MVTLDDLTTPITVDEWRTSIYDVMARVGTNTTSWKPGAVVRTIVTAVAIMLAALSVLSAFIAKGGFLELATGAWLTLLAKYQYGVERQEATFATGQVTITNGGGGVFDFDPEDLIVLNPTTHKTYKNVSAFHLGAGPGATITIDIISTESGTDSNSNPGAITEFETPYLGLTVTNTAAAVGLDEEADAPLRVRCIEKIYTLAFGSRESYSYWGKTIKRENGEVIGVTRTRVSDGSIYGHVDVTVATATGVVPPADLTRIDSELRRIALPAGATLTTQSATAHAVAVTCEVWVSSTMTQVEAQAAIEAAVNSFISSQPIGGVILSGSQGYLFLDALRAAISNTPDLGVLHVTFTSPAADVAIGSLEVATFSAPFTLTAYHQVALAA